MFFELFGDYREFRRCAPPERRVGLSGDSADNGERFRERGAETKDRELREVTKDVVGIHVLLTRSLFACGIPRRFLRPVSLAKLTSVLVRF